MSGLGTIGSGKMGSAIARLAVASGINVVMANSSGPETLGDLVAELGPLASAGTIEQAAAAGETVVVAVPLLAIKTIPPDLLRDRVVLDVSNYYPIRDGRVVELDAETVTEGEMVAQWLVGARYVKAFSNIYAHHITQLSRPSGVNDQTAIPIASNDESAKRIATAVIDQLGFETLDGGSLADSWRFEPKQHRSPASTWLTRMCRTNSCSKQPEQSEPLFRMRTYATRWTSPFVSE